MFTRSRRGLPRNQRQRGLTMIELIVFIIIVGIAVAGVLQVLVVSTKFSADPQMRKQALSLAEGLLEEVELARFSYCDANDPAATTAISTADCDPTLVEKAGLEPDNAVRPYGNINDYVSTYGVEQAMPLTDVNGSALLPPSVTGFTAFLTVTPETLGPPGSTIGTSSTTDPANTDVLRVRVRVHYANDDIVLDGYRTRYAPNFTQ